MLHLYRSITLYEKKIAHCPTVISATVWRVIHLFSQPQKIASAKNRHTNVSHTFSQGGRIEAYPEGPALSLA